MEDLKETRKWIKYKLSERRLLCYHGKRLKSGQGGISELNVAFKDDVLCVKDKSGQSGCAHPMWVVRKLKNLADMEIRFFVLFILVA